MLAVAGSASTALGDPSFWGVADDPSQGSVAGDPSMRCLVCKKGAGTRLLCQFMELCWQRLRN